jgi:hypothetical protein
MPARKAEAQVLLLGVVYLNATRGEKPIKVHCHLCGATLRGTDQYQRLEGPAQRDAVYVCRDERRCQLRAARDPLTGERHPSSTQPRDAMGKEPGIRASVAELWRATPPQ